ncbi:LOW QUALITY PROTEIN: hypothetical protein HZS_4848 [Henneguya salminicola]|nr:LOW QUALITY PROTEIN: hypothetical protein HZS_4848 [Henneguya salminicola]
MAVKYIKLLIYCEKINCGSIQIYNHGNSFIRKDGEILSDDENFILYGCIRFSDEYGVLHNNLYAHIVKNIRFYVKKDIFKNFTFSDKKFKICLVKLKINSIILLKNKIALFYKNNQKKFYGIPKVGKVRNITTISRTIQQFFFHCLYINNELSLLDQAIIKINLNNNYSRYIETNFNGSSENMKLEMRIVISDLFQILTSKLIKYVDIYISIKAKELLGIQTKFMK